MVNRKERFRTTLEFRVGDLEGCRSIDQDGQSGFEFGKRELDSDRDMLTMKAPRLPKTSR